MNIQELEYSLKPENIASEPPDVRLGKRDLGRMLVVNRVEESFHDSYVYQLSQWLQAGDTIILNNSKRIPGELKGRTRRGAQVDLRFAGVDTLYSGLCRIYPTHFIELGLEVVLSNNVSLVVTSAHATKHGLFHVSVKDNVTTLPCLLNDVGLPITSFYSNGYWKLENYNTCYASVEGSIESPMAGLHFTPDLLVKLKDEGINIGFITLHSVGSWLPFEEENVSEHTMLPEKFFIPQETSNLLRLTRDSGRRVLACGSTVMRTLESAYCKTDFVRSGEGETQLFITPEHTFKAVDMYFTNFHTFRSSLMVLDASFTKIDFVKKAYKRAADTGYLFHEFGDAVLYI